MCLSQGGSLAWVPRVRLRSASAVTTGHFPISRHARAGTATAYAMPPLTRSTFGYAGGSAQPIGTAGLLAAIVRLPVTLPRMAAQGQGQG